MSTPRIGFTVKTMGPRLPRRLKRSWRPYRSTFRTLRLSTSVPAREQYALAFPFKEISGWNFLRTCISARRLTSRDILSPTAGPYDPFIAMLLNSRFRMDRSLRFSTIHFQRSVLRNVRSSLDNSPRVLYVCTLRVEDD